MALDPKYFVTGDLQTWFVSKDTGLPLINGTLHFYDDNARTVPKNVFQLSGSPPNYGYASLGSVVTLSNVGTPQNSGGDHVIIYYYPFDEFGNQQLYYIQIFDENGNFQYNVEAWPNQQGAGSSPPVTTSNENVNQISNPTFTNFFIPVNTPVTYTVTGANQVFDFAPDWDFLISGSGTVDVTIVSIAGSASIPTSPPYILNVTTNVGITSCYLRQRFNTNSGLWASTANPIYLSGGLVVQNVGIGLTSISMIYQPSTGSPTTIFSTNVGGIYTYLSGTSVAIPASTDPNSGSLGYIDVYISFSPDTSTNVSSINLFPSSTIPVSINIPLDSSNRNEAYQGDYYIPRLNAKPTDSFLVGWDFPVSPYQFGLSGTVYATPPNSYASYICDQTIAICSGANIAWTQDPTTNGLSFTTADAGNAFYLLQYLSGDQILDMIGNTVSANVFAYQTDIVATNPVTMQVYLFSAPSSVGIPTLPTTIGTIAVDGTFTPTAAGWVPIPRSGLPSTPVTLTNNSAGNITSASDYGFVGWDLTNSAQIANTDLFAIVVTFAYVNAATTLTVNSISCVPGDIPCRPAIKSADEVLRQCQYYYEKSFDGVTPDAATQIRINASIIKGAPNDTVFLQSFSWPFKVKKRIALPVNGNYLLSGRSGLAFWESNGISSNFNFILLSIFQVNVAISTSNSFNAQTNWSSPTNIYQIFMNATNGTVNVVRATAPSNQGLLTFHYIADCRLGIPF